MTSRRRFLETLLFGAPDRIPFAPGGGRESTLARWVSEGMPAGRGPMPAVYERVNTARVEKRLPPIHFDTDGTGPRLSDVSFVMNPKFEEKVLEHKDGHYIVQDYMGAITEISDQYDFTYIRSAKDFVTRRWHKFPVETWEDWERMKARFDPRDPGRFPPDFAERCAVLCDRNFPLVLGFNGPFWQLREFCGMENLCMFMYEQPELVQAMAEYWKDFCSVVMAGVLEHVVPDMLHISEDMAYKEKPMISPGMTERFCAPAYRQWGEQVKAAGTELFAVDSDGHIALLVPVWLDCGINCVDPVEVAAGNDINELRRVFGNRLAFRGGIDKRAIAAGDEALKAELNRVAPVIADGGYIPGCDHGVPADVSWHDFQDYCFQLAALTGWLD